MSLLDRHVPERDLAAMLEGYAALRGWMYFHPWVSVHSAPGFVDYVLVREGRLIFSELKKVGGKTTLRQRRWLWALGTAAIMGRCEVYLWTISDWPQVERVLR